MSKANLYNSSQSLRKKRFKKKIYVPPFLKCKLIKGNKKNNINIKNIHLLIAKFTIIDFFLFLNSNLDFCKKKNCKKLFLI